ncbi:MAG TPA: hypothetical protein PLB73_06085, partial [Leptospiraceae bacterium]|nr:hypothetical protein [Leptospiraceae bacterium]
NLRIPFKSLNRVDLLLRGKTIPALARAGAQIVWMGAESGSQKILDAMEKGAYAVIHKPVTAAQMQEIMSTLV